MGNAKKKRKKRAKPSHTTSNKRHGAGRKQRRPKFKAQPQPLVSNIFTITNSDLNQLTPERAVEVVRYLLWADARSAGVPLTSIHISSHTDVPDGGIDATVDEALSKTDVIRKGHNGFQIKAGTLFEPWRRPQIRTALFGDKAVAKANLGPAVKACLDSKGTYVLICTGSDPTPAQLRHAVGHIKTHLGRCGYKTAKVEVWGQSHLIGLLRKFPSLSLYVNGRGGLRFQTHKSWGRQDDMRKQFKAGAQQTQFLAGLQEELRRNEGAVHVRIVGEPGVGKTKYAFEGTAAEDIAALVLYCGSAEEFRDSDLMNELLKDDNEFTAVLIVDECDADARADIWNKLKHRGPRIKLISIYNERDESSGNIVYADAPPLGKDEIVAIIHEYEIPPDQAERWAEFCSGSPRVVHVIGANLRNNPEDLLKSPDTVDVWERYIVGADDPQNPRVGQRRVVLQHLALFKRFGYGPRVDAEARAIAEIIQEADSQITWARFQEVIRELRERKILQGEATLYITPKALHIKLWVDWWETYGGSFDPEEFAAKLTGKLVEWSDDMFRYAAESPAALRVVDQLVGENGPFQAGHYLEDRRGADLFVALTEASPKASLECLRNTVGKWSEEKLRGFTTGRREIVWALQRIVIWRELFPDAARLLLKLGETENEMWGNNASGVFAELFSPAYGRVAPTEAPPEERLPVLKEALNSPTKEQRLLGIRAATKALESHHFSRFAGAEHQGLRKEPGLWMPKTWEELFNAYRAVWNLLLERLEDLEADERKKAIDTLLHQAGGLARYPNLFDMVINGLSHLAEKPYADKKTIVETVERILYYQRKDLPAEMRQRWQELRNRLVGDDFPSLMQRYVAMEIFEDEISDEGEPADKTGPVIAKLVTEALDHPESLGHELGWLVTDEAKNGYRFGYALGTHDAKLALLSMLLNAQRGAGQNSSGFFLGGYVRSIRERDVQRWESLLDELSADDALRSLVPELTWRSGKLTDRAAERVLSLAKSGAIEGAHFQMFAYGSVTTEVSSNVFRQWLEFLLEVGTLRAVTIGVDLHHFYYGRKESTHAVPKELTLKLLIAPALFQKEDGTARSDKKVYDWTEVGKVFVRTYPTDSLPIAKKMLEHFGEDGTIAEGFHSQPQAVLNEITRLFPREVWQEITKYLGPPIDSRAYHIKSWLRGEQFQARGEQGILPLIPLEEIWKWVDDDSEKRAWYLATFVPKQLFRRENQVCLARELLVRHGDKKDVRGSLMANFSSEGWSGPASLHYEAKRRELLEFKKDETNANVKRWIDEYVAALDRRIEHERIEEERHGF